MKCLNGETLLKLERMPLIQNGKGGVLLLVAGKQGKEYLTTVSVPRIRTINTKDASAFGTVKLGDIFSDTMLKYVLSCGTASTSHMITASSYWQTRLTNSSLSKLELMGETAPIILAPRDLIGSRIGTTTIQRIKVLAKLRCPPVC